MTISELKALAEKATPKWKDAGDWFHDHTVGVTLSDDDAAYIAASSPAVVLDLLARLEAMEKALEFYATEFNWHHEIVECGEFDCAHKEQAARAWKALSHHGSQVPLGKGER